MNYWRRLCVAWKVKLTYCRIFLIHISVMLVSHEGSEWADVCVSRSSHTYRKNVVATPPPPKHPSLPYETGLNMECCCIYIYIFIYIPLHPPNVQSPNHRCYWLRFWYWTSFAYTALVILARASHVRRASYHVRHLVRHVRHTIINYVYMR